MSAVEACTIPVDTIALNRFLLPSSFSLALVFKHLLHTRSKDGQGYVVNNRSALRQWRDAKEDELKYAWSAPSADRELFAKAMVWWDRRLQLGDLAITQMPPNWVLQGWLRGDTSMERHWHEASKRWDTLPFDPARASSAAHSLSKTPMAQLGLRAAHIYGLDRRDWEERNAATRD
ncbi:hypothetical protein JCM9279_000581 [Rhodotorula babjevae]